MHRGRVLFASILPLAFLLTSCGRPAPLPSGQWTSLGTVCSVNAFEDGTEALYAAIGARLSEIDASFSVNRESSSISHINRAAGAARVSVGEDVFFVIRSALDFAERSIS